MAAAGPVKKHVQSLLGKVALITGSTSGIGMATARLFVARGAKVIATGRNKQALEQLQKQIGCAIVAGDLTEKGIPEHIVNTAAKAHGELTTLVNCAGVLKGGVVGTDACDMDNFMFNFRHNTLSTVEMIQHAVPWLKKAGKDRNPSIINVSSVNGLVSFGGTASYCASKAAVDMFTKCAAVDLAPHGVRCNAVNPGVVITELQKRGGLDEAQYKAFLERSVKITHPLGASLGRVADPVEVAQLIAFLASDEARFITGDSIKIDGGRGCVGAR